MENPGEIYSLVELRTPERENLNTHPSYSPGSLETGGSLGRFKISRIEPEGGRGMGKIKWGFLLCKNTYQVQAGGIRR